MPKDSLSNIYVLFDDTTTELLLNYIRKNIYADFPYKSLCTSSLLNNATVEKEIEDNYIAGGGFSRFLKLAYTTTTCVHKLYFNGEYLGTVKNFATHLFTNKHIPEYQKIVQKQKNL